MLPDVTARLYASWETTFPGERRPPGIEYLNVTGSLEGGTTTFLGFARGARTPLFAVKIARHRVGVRLDREAALLRELTRDAGAWVRAVPRVLHHSVVDDCDVLVLAVVPGRPPAVAYGRDGHLDVDRAGRELRAAAAWLMAMNRATRTTDAAASARARARLAWLGRAYLETFAPSGREAILVDRAIGAIEALVARGLVVQHGDFTRQNILMIRAGRGAWRVSGVIDWTWAERDGLLAHDLLFLVVGYFLQARREPGLAGFVNAFRSCMCDATPGRVLVRGLLDEYCAVFEIPPADLDPLVTWFLIERTMADCRLLDRCAANGSLPRWALLLAWEARLPRRLAPRAPFWPALLRELAGVEHAAA